MTRKTLIALRNSDRLFVSRDYCYCTRSITLEIRVPKLDQTYSVTNPHCVAQIVFRNIHNYLCDFDSSPISAYKIMKSKRLLET